MGFKQRLAFIVFGLGFVVSAEAGTYQQDRAAILAMTGCFLVDYSYVETESLREGYTVDRRVYDVNRKNSVKEWIFATEIAEGKIRLQHLLFAADPTGQVVTASFLKHQADDWEYEPAAMYDFTSPSFWKARELTTEQSSGKWVRKITNLDDGLRHQCLASWQISDAGYAEWSCASNSPIPGRETRDMGRKDYQGLNRLTRLVVYGQSYLERQDNTKLVWETDKFVPLARETGKNWYVRLPESECGAIREWATPRQAFWNLLQETWDEVLDGTSDFREQVPAGKPPRFVSMMMLEAKVASEVARSSDARAAAKAEILKIIDEYRAK